MFGEKEVHLEPTEAAQGRDLSMLVSDPPEHDRMRRQFMRHFGPPHTPDLIPSMGAMVEDLANSLLDKVAAAVAPGWMWWRTSPIRSRCR